MVAFVTRHGIRHSIKINAVICLFFPERPCRFLFVRWNYVRNFGEIIGHCLVVTVRLFYN